MLYDLLDMNDIPLIMKTHDINLMVKLFDDFIEITKKCYLEITGFSTKAMKEVNITRPITHRHSASYGKKILRKFYILNKYIIDNYRGLTTMMTLTSRHSLYTDPIEFIEDLQTAKRMLLDLIRHDYTEKKKLEYIWVIEPHKSGHAHVHVMFLGLIAPKDQDKYKRIWSEKYGMGSYTHGVHFSLRNRSVKVKNYKNYLMKYISKSITATDDGYKRLASTVFFQGLRIPELGKKSSIVRLWGASRELLHVMKLPVRVSNFIVKTINLYYSGFSTFLPYVTMYDNIYYHDEVSEYVYNLKVESS